MIYVILIKALRLICVYKLCMEQKIVNELRLSLYV